MSSQPSWQYDIRQNAALSQGLLPPPPPGQPVQQPPGRQGCSYASCLMGYYPASRPAAGNDAKNPATQQQGPPPYASPAGPHPPVYSYSAPIPIQQLPPPPQHPQNTYYPSNPYMQYIPNLPPWVGIPHAAPTPGQGPPAPLSIVDSNYCIPGKMSRSDCGGFLAAQEDRWRLEDSLRGLVGDEFETASDFEAQITDEEGDDVRRTSRCYHRGRKISPLCSPQPESGRSEKQWLHLEAQSRSDEDIRQTALLHASSPERATHFELPRSRRENGQRVVRSAPNFQPTKSTAQFGPTHRPTYSRQTVRPQARSSNAPTSGGSKGPSQDNNPDSGPRNRHLPTQDDPSETKLPDPSNRLHGGGHSKGKQPFKSGWGERLRPLAGTESETHSFDQGQSGISGPGRPARSNPPAPPERRLLHLSRSGRLYDPEKDVDVSPSELDRPGYINHIRAHRRIIAPTILDFRNILYTFDEQNPHWILVDQEVDADALRDLLYHTRLQHARSLQEVGWHPAAPVDLVSDSDSTESNEYSESDLGCARGWLTVAESSSNSRIRGGAGKPSRDARNIRQKSLKSDDHSEQVLPSISEPNASSTSVLQPRLPQRRVVYLTRENRLYDDVRRHQVNPSGLKNSDYINYICAHRRQISPQVLESRNIPYCRHEKNPRYIIVQIDVTEKILVELLRQTALWRGMREDASDDNPNSIEESELIEIPPGPMMYWHPVWSLERSTTQPDEDDAETRILFRLTRGAHRFLYEGHQITETMYNRAAKTIHIRAHRDDFARDVLAKYRINFNTVAEEPQSIEIHYPLHLQHALFERLLEESRSWFRAAERHSGEAHNETPKDADNIEQGADEGLASEAEPRQRENPTIRGGGLSHTSSPYPRSPTTSPSFNTSHIPFTHDIYLTANFVFHSVDSAAQLQNDDSDGSRFDESHIGMQVRYRGYYRRVRQSTRRINARGQLRGGYRPPSSGRPCSRSLSPVSLPVGGVDRSPRYRNPYIEEDLVSESDHSISNTHIGAERHWEAFATRSRRNAFSDGVSGPHNLDVGADQETMRQPPAAYLPNISRPRSPPPSYQTNRSPSRSSVRPNAQGGDRDANADERSPFPRPPMGEEAQLWDPADHVNSPPGTFMNTTKNSDGNLEWRGPLLVYFVERRQRRRRAGANEGRRRRRRRRRREQVIVGREKT